MAADAAHTSFDPPGSIHTSAYAINFWGTATGYYWDAQSVLHGWLRDSQGTITSFDPPGSIYTYPDGINDFGAITGIWTNVLGANFGFLRLP